MIRNGVVSTKNDKRDDFYFDVVVFPDLGHCLLVSFTIEIIK